VVPLRYVTLFKDMQGLIMQSVAAQDYFPWNALALKASPASFIKVLITAVLLLYTCCFNRMFQYRSNFLKNLRRIDPHDGYPYTLDEIKERLGRQGSTDLEIRKYWQDDCKHVPGSKIERGRLCDFLSFERMRKMKYARLALSYGARYSTHLLMFVAYFLMVKNNFLSRAQCFILVLLIMNGRLWKFAGAIVSLTSMSLLLAQYLSQFNDMGSTGLSIYMGFEWRSSLVVSEISLMLLGIFQGTLQRVNEEVELRNRASWAQEAPPWAAKDVQIIGSGGKNGVLDMLTSGRWAIRWDDGHQTEPLAWAALYSRCGPIIEMNWDQQVQAELVRNGAQIGCVCMLFVSIVDRSAWSTIGVLVVVAFAVIGHREHGDDVLATEMLDIVLTPYRSRGYSRETHDEIHHLGGIALQRHP